MNCADRAARATASDDFNTSADRVANDASYAKESLATYTAPQPDDLGIEGSRVLQAHPTTALTTYTDFQVLTASTTNWGLALVAMVPCIQVDPLLADTAALC